MKKDYAASDLSELLEMLDSSDVLDALDDSLVINMSTDDVPYEVNIEYVLIQDENAIELFCDEDYDPGS